MLQQLENISIQKITSGLITEVEDQVAIEEPLGIQLEWSNATGRMKRNIAVTMCTPGNEEELAAGFLFTESIIDGYSSISHITYKPATANVVLVVLKENIFPRLHNAERNFYTTSSCGICGKASIDAITSLTFPRRSANTISVSTKILFELPLLLKNEQAVFQHTGGLHACALFTPAGKFILVREDIGRHNALDKVIGHALANESISLSQHILLLSGRASFELVQKAAMAGIQIIAAVGAPSSLAVSLAIETGITLAGFLRDGRCNLYSGYDRVIL